MAGFITNVPEELDAEREYWFNESDHSLLYVAADDKPPAASTFEHARLKQLFTVRGTQQQRQRLLARASSGLRQGWGRSRGGPSSAEGG